MVRVFLGVGSNQGERLAHISRAIRAVADEPGVALRQMAPIIETAAVGGPPQGPYLNTVIEVDTALGPHDLLRRLQAIERRLGREPSPERWAPRPIDLDILLYGEQVVEEPGLVIPHPRLHERAFVLEPLAQLAPEVLHPVMRESVGALRAKIAAAAISDIEHKMPPTSKRDI